jgi:BON domain
MLRRRLLLSAFSLSLLLALACNKPSDDAVTTSIKAKLYSEPLLKSASVDVVVKDGIVTLTGQVPDDAARRTTYRRNDARRKNSCRPNHHGSSASDNYRGKPCSTSTTGATRAAGANSTQGGYTSARRCSRSSSGARPKRRP